MEENTSDKGIIVVAGARPVKECLVFDVFGDFGCFKKHYTTSSPLTFDFPPKTALAGLVGAIIGLDFDGKYELFDGLMGISILSAGRKIYTGINWIDTKARDAKLFDDGTNNKAFLEALGLPATPDTGVFIGMTWDGKGNRNTQINVEILVDPRYRIFYPDSSPYYKTLKEHVTEHKAVYTPFLGISEFIANFELVDVARVQEVKGDDDEVEISSVIPVIDPNSFVSPAGSNGSYMFIDRLPRTMIPGRVVTDYVTFVYAIGGTRLLSAIPSYFRVKGDRVDDNVIFF